MADTVCFKYLGTRFKLVKKLVLVGLCVNEWTSRFRLCLSREWIIVINTLKEVNCIIDFQHQLIMLTATRARKQKGEIQLLLTSSNWLHSRRWRGSQCDNNYHWTTKKAYQRMLQQKVKGRVAYGHKSMNLEEPTTRHFLKKAGQFHSHTRKRLTPKQGYLIGLPKDIEKNNTQLNNSTYNRTRTSGSRWKTLESFN